MAHKPRPNLKELKPFIGEWGLPTLSRRIEKRLNSSIEELKAFHDAIVPRLEEIIDYLNQFPLDAIPEEDKPLSYATLAALEVENPVNKWNSATLEDAVDPRRFRIKTDFYDTTWESGYN